MNGALRHCRVCLHPTLQPACFAVYSRQPSMQRLALPSSLALAAPACLASLMPRPARNGSCGAAVHCPACPCGSPVGLGCWARCCADPASGVMPIGTRWERIFGGHALPVLMQHAGHGCVPTWCAACHVTPVACMELKWRRSDPVAWCSEVTAIVTDPARPSGQAASRVQQDKDVGGGCFSVALLAPDSRCTVNPGESQPNNTSVLYTLMLI